MNPLSFTYNGTTVSYSQAQKDIIVADQNLITQLNSQLAAHQNEYARLEGVINEAKSKLDNYCNTLSGVGGSNSPRSKCQATYNNQWDTARAQQGTVAGYITANATQTASAVKKLNDDIITIQNDIKLQIQTQQANAAAEAAAANNQSTVSTAPAVVAANAAAIQTQLANEAAAAKLKQEQTIKVVGFVLLAIVLISVGFLLVRRAV